MTSRFKIYTRSARSIFWYAWKRNLIASIVLRGVTPKGHIVTLNMHRTIAAAAISGSHVLLVLDES